MIYIKISDKWQDHVTGLYGKKSGNVIEFDPGTGYKLCIRGLSITAFSR